MKKSLYLVVVLLAVSMFLYSAGEQETESGDTTVVRVWANDAHNKPEYTSTIQEFMDNEGKELGIKIDHQVYGGDYYNSLDIAIAAGEEPHVFKSRKSGQYAEMGKIIPLKDLPGGQKLIDETAGLHMEDVGMFNGEVYAIPIRVTTQNLIYNKELFNELNLKVPESWADMREAAKKITEAGKGRVYGFALPLKYANYKYYFVGFPAAPSIGHQFFNHKTGRFDFMSLSPYFDFIQQMIDDGSMFPGIENLDFDTMRAQFAAGNIGMLIGNSFDVGVLYDQFPAQMEWGVAPIPVMDPNNRYKQVGNPGAFYVISSKVKEEGIEDEVMEVYKKLVSIEHLAKTYENGKDIPIRGAEVTSHAAEPSREQFKAFADLTNVYIKPAYPESKIRVEGESYSDVFSKIITGRVDTEKALADLDERYNKAIDEAIDNGRLDISQYIDPNYDEKVKYVR